MLYYLKVEVLGDASSEALEGMSARYGTAGRFCAHKKKFNKNVGNVRKQRRDEYSFCFQLLSSPWVDIYGSG